MPHDGLGEVARAPVMQEQRVTVDGLGKADAPERRRAPFASRSLAVGAVVCKSLAHVVQQEVGVRPDQLMRKMRLARRFAGHEFRLVATRTANGIEQLLALQQFWVRRIAPRRHGEVVRVEGDELEQIVAELDVLILRRVAVRRGKALLLLCGTVA